MPTSPHMLKCLVPLPNDAVELRIPGFFYSPSSGQIVSCRKMRKDQPNMYLPRLPTKHLGYIGVSCGFTGMNYYGHRLAWEAINGKIPDDMEIDHINGIKWDNRLINLRLVSHAENTRKTNWFSQSAKNVLPGVRINGRASRSRWMATVEADGKRHNFYSWPLRAQAYEAYIILKMILHGPLSVSLLPSVDYAWSLERDQSRRVSAPLTSHPHPPTVPTV